MTDSRYRPEIDGLRAVAVAAVVIYHASAGILPGGFVGVDVFFVISGYLITSILLQEWLAAGKIDFAAFYARRMRRLLPALAVVLLATALAACVVLPRLNMLPSFAESAMASVLFVANAYFELHTGGYFDAGTDRQPLLHLWSLAVEEQFYLVYPLLLVAMLRYAHGWGVWVLGLLSLGSLWLAEYWLGVSPGTAFYQMPSRFWELAIGGMIAFGKDKQLAAARASAQVGLGLLLIGTSTLLLRDDGSFPGLGALAPVVGTALVLHAVHGTNRLEGIGRLLSLKPMVWLGLISYPLYLWHWPLLVMDQLTRLGPAGVGWRLLLCLVAVALAWLTYKYVEGPFRRARLSRPSVVLKRAAIGMAGMLAGFAWLTTINFTVEGAELAARTRRDQPPDIASCHFGAHSLNTSLAPESCRSRPGLPVRVVIWGDSHALAWKPFAWALSEHGQSAAVAHTMDSCPPVQDFHGKKTSAPRFGEQCARFNAAVSAAIQSGRYDLLVVSARWPSHFGVPMTSVAERARPANLPGHAATPEEIKAGLRATLEMASRSVQRVIVIGPTPVMNFEVPDCLAMERLSECAVSRAEFQLAAKSSQDALLAAAAGLPNVEVIDPTAFFCPGAECGAVRDGYGLFWDDDHVSSTAAREFAASFIATPQRFRISVYDTPANRSK
jgi:peptidoglycan/LPS O-acetylase OafA/YrhL